MGFCLLVCVGVWYQIETILQTKCDKIMCEVSKAIHKVNMKWHSVNGNLQKHIQNVLIAAHACVFQNYILLVLCD